MRTARAWAMRTSFSWILCSLAMCLILFACTSEPNVTVDSAVPVVDGAPGRDASSLPDVPRPEDASGTDEGSPVADMGRIDVSPPIEGEVRLGVLGDSDSDEYRADDNRGGAFAETTLCWTELLARALPVDLGEWGVRGEPRRTGFEFNWARSGARSHTMVSSGQHTGLAEQIATGRVTHALIRIGTNDVHARNGSYREIYDGSLSGSALREKIARIITSITTAVDTLRAAGDIPIVVTTLLDPGASAIVHSVFPDEAGRRRGTEAVGAINVGILALRESRSVGIWDYNDFARTSETRLDSGGGFDFAGERIEVLSAGDEPHHAALDDGHAGTVINGLTANAIVEVFAEMGSPISAPLTEGEILGLAGIR